MGREAYDLNVQQYCCAGLNFGYFYENSPIIAHDGAEAPAYGMEPISHHRRCPAAEPHTSASPTAVRSTTPWVQNTPYLRNDLTKNPEPLLEAAHNRGLPLRLLDIDDPAADELYPNAFTLSRPDQHVAWRGDRIPDDPLALVDKLRGAR